MELQQRAIAKLVLANRILAHYGILDSFGHISVRSPIDSRVFLLSSNKAPASIEADDIMTLNLDGEVVDGHGKSYLERFIHSEIYRARHDVMAIVHSHSPAVIPFSVVASQPLRPIWHVAAGIGKCVPIFDIADYRGSATDLLISDMQLGKDLVNSLKKHRTVLMRGHGITVVAETLEGAVFNAYYIEMNARLQYQAISLGEIKYLSNDEIDAAWATNLRVVDRAWSNWCRVVKLDGLQSS
jgi:HCOMODA/2-hydroxy-3-carboxy-muconic semialdehyde decarboxylase